MIVSSFLLMSHPLKPHRVEPAWQVQLRLYHFPLHFQEDSISVSHGLLSLPKAGHSPLDRSTIFEDHSSLSYLFEAPQFRWVFLGDSSAILRNSGFLG
ncbi:hypothetical protein AVEN_221661-1 [Araneus ventricosus]|uniref:Uncharacterized protein n=1 Tax=Araneus ventricosus TaxID=182803 RepID=A0A4Y2QKM1_ARAVE|nr:hypothetical protein AVEN_221661-1 [Araneus ventricosus]